MSEDRLRTIFAEGQPDWLCEPAIRGIDDGKVIELLDTQSYFDLLSLPYPSDRAGVLERLKSEGIILLDGRVGWSISNFGAVLFAKNLTKFPNLARKAPRVIVYEGKENSILNSIERGRWDTRWGFRAF